jgi:hypothetical protein
VTAVDDPEAFASPDPELAFAHTRAAGATFVRLTLRWYGIAPQRPADPEDPADPTYRWAGFDNQVELAVANGLQPIVTIEDAPAWAQGTPPPGSWPPALVAFWNVDAGALGSFARAAATRYGGGFAGLPRVRYWMVWNEPNLSQFLNPQLRSQLTTKPTYPFDSDDVVSADLYRNLVNSMYAAVHAVHPDNLVIAGGTSPFSGTSGVVSVGPLLFMRKLLCLSADQDPKPVCDDTVHFDIWSTHPYTAGGPTHSAGLPDDVSLGDLPRMSRLLRAGVAARHVISARPVAYWVTEFGWDTTPPDCCAVPLQLHARWVAEALYRMWLDGIDLVTWFLIRDQAPNGRPDGQVLQSGLYFRGSSPASDQPKPALAAFRFPFVAFTSGRGIRVWGRTPWGKPGAVSVERSSSTGWRRLARLRSDRFGVFQGVLRSAGGGQLVRARLVDGSASAVPFSLQAPPDLVVNPFGG